MPSNRDFLLLVLWLAVAAGLLLASSKDEVRGIAPPPAALKKLNALDPSAIREVHLSAGGEDFVMAREGDGWIVPTWFDTPAESEKVESLLGMLIALGGAEPRGASSRSHATFAVTEDDYQIELRGEGEGLPFILTVGKVAAFDRFFARFGDDAGVYSLTPNLRLGAELGNVLNPEKWLNLLVVEIPEQIEITGFRIETEAGVIVVDHVTEETTTPSGEPATVVTWKVVEPEVFEAELDIVRSLQKSVRTIRAATVVDPARLAETGLENPRGNLTVFIRDGEPIVIELGEEGESAKAKGRRGVFARRRGSERLFLLPTWMETNLFKQLDQFRTAPPAPPIPPTPTGE